MNHLTGRRKLTAVAASLAIVFAATGCGSSKKSSTGSSAAPAITKAEFLAKGNAICQQGNVARTKAGNALGNNPSRKQILDYVTKSFIPGIQSTIDQLRALGAPAGDQAKVTGMLNLAQADLDKLKAKPILLANGPGLFHNFAVRAHAYGLTQCAKNA